MNQNQPTILLTPLRTALLVGHDNQIHVLVRVQAPDRPQGDASRRLPCHLALVLDRSGSMSGEPLAEALRCARHMVERLETGDRAALVVFDHGVDVLTPLIGAGEKQAFLSQLEMIREGGNTNLHGGWAAGAAELAGVCEQAGLSRVILLSDGNANAGETRLDRIIGQCAERAAAGVTTSTYGLGRSFNEDLMVAMAQAGQGNHYYGETANDLFEPFATEFDLIANLYARGVRLTLTPAPGVELSLLNDYRALPDSSGWQLPDIAWGSEAWALLSLRVPSALTGQGSVPLLQASVSGVDLEGRPVDFPVQSLALPPLGATAYAAIAEDTLVARRRGELEAARHLGEARVAASQGDWRSVERILQRVETELSENPWLAQVIDTIRRIAQGRDAERFLKEARFSERSLTSRLSSKEETLYACVEEELGVPSFLRRKRAQGQAESPSGGEA